MKHEIIERFNIKELDSIIIIEKFNIKELDSIIIIRRKIETEKIENINKTKAYRIRMKSIRQKAKRKREGINIERTNKLKKIEGMKIDIREMRLRIYLMRVVNSPN